MNLTEYLEWLGIFEGAECLPNIIQVLDSLPMKPETPWYDAQTACETAIKQQFRGGDVCGAVTHTRGASNAEIRRYGWIVSGGKHYCSKECKDEDKGRNRSAQAIMRTLR